MITGSQEHDNGVPNIGEKHPSTEIHTDALDFYGECLIRLMLSLLSCKIFTSVHCREFYHLQINIYSKNHLILCNLLRKYLQNILLENLVGKY